jgi:hypothetical protein
MNERLARPEGVDLAARSRARRRALQATYAWQVSGTDMRGIIEQFKHEQEMEIADLDYFEDLLVNIERHCADLDEAISPHLDRNIASVDPIERAVLRLAAYELLHRLGRAVSRGDQRGDRDHQALRRRPRPHLRQRRPRQARAQRAWQRIPPLMWPRPSTNSH